MTGKPRKGSARRPSRRRAAKPDPFVGQVVDTEIHGVGGKGDGLSVTAEGNRLYVPFSAPGDRVRVRVEQKRGDGYSAQILAVLAPGPNRKIPICPYFGTCGGCALQHLNQGVLDEWKRQQVVEAFRRQGLSPMVDALVSPPLGTRRRVTFEVEYRDGKALMGFNARQSHKIVDIKNCPLLLSPLNHLIKPLRGLVPKIAEPNERGDIAINYVEGRTDIVLALHGELTLERLEALSDFAKTHNIARVSRLRGGETPELVVSRSPVEAKFAKIPVALPAGAFLQPSAEGEWALVERVIHALGDAHRVADLFAGCGTFSFPLATHASVKAVESSPSMIAALSAAAGRANLGGKLVTETRDLERQPLMGKELEPFDAVVFDPPRAGACDQAVALAASSVATVIAVSCNPTTLARDARLLIDGGYRLTKVTPIDQFPFAPHMEAVAVFSKLDEEVD